MKMGKRRINKEKKDLELNQSLSGFLQHFFLHNGGFKLLALLISVLFWAGLISQDETLTRDKTFSDVSVNITGSDTMKRNGYIVVSDLAAMLDDVSVVAEVPQHRYETADASF